MKLFSGSRGRLGVAAAALALLGAAGALRAWQNGNEVRLITLDPGHFHAALVLREMLPGVSNKVSVYAPLGPELLDHLTRIERFNSRSDNPTRWELNVHCTSRPLEEMLADRPGSVVVISGRSHDKIHKIQASLDAGLNVLGDKPWIIRAANFPALEAALQTASRKGLVAYDIMTERYEITTILQRELVNDPAVFGTIVPGSEADPAVFMESVHQIAKLVDGVPNPRPTFFFDIEEEGQGLADVGTHLVDLVHWTLFPNGALDYRQDIRLSGSKRWPTVLTPAQFEFVTGKTGFPAELAPYVHAGRFDYYGNGQVRYQARGVHVQLNVLWNYEPPSGTDRHHALYRGTNARIEVRQGARAGDRPELYVAPAGQERRAAVGEALRSSIARLQSRYPGLGVEAAGNEWRVTVPDRLRIGHEAHFAQVLAQFLEYLKAPKTMPSWERSNMLAKYYVTTSAVQLSEAATAR